jgi:DNA-binding MarR family transcriptional regulator
MQMTSASLLEKYGVLKRNLSLLAHRHFSKIGLNNQQALVLKLLSEHTELSVTELAEKTRSDQASISRTLSSLEKSGFIARKKAAADARVLSSQLTKKGKNKSLELKELYTGFAEKTFSFLSREEKQNFMEILETLNTNIEKLL